MNNNELKEQISNIKIGHLYIGEIKLTEIDDYKKDFAEYKSFDFTNPQININIYHVLFIELKTLNKENFKLLNAIVKKNLSKEIYLFSSDLDNTFLLKFALHFSLNKIQYLQSNKVDFKKFLFEVSRKYLTSHNDKMQVEISKKINSFFALLIFKEDKLIFANEKVKNLFNTQKLLDIENVIKNSQKIYKLLNSNNSLHNIEVTLKNHNNEVWNYAFYCDKFSHSDEKLITIVPLHKVEEIDAFLSTISRFKFIEILKDKLAQNSINQTPMTLICISISNYSKLIESSGSILVHNFVKKFISKLCLYKDSCQDLTQWSPHFLYFY